MAIQPKISEATYEAIALTEPDKQWELVDGQLRERPGMSYEHGRTVMLLSRTLLLQLDVREFEIRINDGRVRRPGSVYIPDLIVFPTAYGATFRGQPGKLLVLSDPLPLVVEVWSSSTGAYDIDTKLPIYKQRGDEEIWYIHPYERTLTAWRRLPDGTYAEATYREGVIRPMALPGVEVELDELFEVEHRTTDV